MLARSELKHSEDLPLGVPATRRAPADLSRSGMRSTARDEEGARVLISALLRLLDLSRCAFPQGEAVCNRQEALKSAFPWALAFKPRRELDARLASEVRAILTWLLASPLAWSGRRAVAFSTPFALPAAPVPRPRSGHGHCRNRRRLRRVRLGLLGGCGQS